MPTLSVPPVSPAHSLIPGTLALSPTWPDCWQLYYDYGAHVWVLTAGGGAVGWTTTLPYDCDGPNAFDNLLWNHTGYAPPAQITLWPLSDRICECPPVLGIPPVPGPHRVVTPQLGLIPQCCSNCYFVVCCSSPGGWLDGVALAVYLTSVGSYYLYQSSWLYLPGLTAVPYPGDLIWISAEVDCGIGGLLRWRLALTVGHSAPTEGAPIFPFNSTEYLDPVSISRTLVGTLCQPFLGKWFFDQVNTNTHFYNFIQPAAGPAGLDVTVTDVNVGCARSGSGPPSSACCTGNCGDANVAGTLTATLTAPTGCYVGVPPVINFICQPLLPFGHRWLQTSNFPYCGGSGPSVITCLSETLPPLWGDTAGHIITPQPGYTCFPFSAIYLITDGAGSSVTLTVVSP
jgi:hypothetical protein